MSETNTSNYIKSPDGGFLLKDDQVNIEKDELGRPVVNLSTTPPSVSDETAGKVLTNDGEKVGWSNGYGVTVGFDPLAMPVSPDFVFNIPELSSPIVFSKEKASYFYYFNFFEFSESRLSGYALRNNAPMFTDFRLTTDKKLNFCVLQNVVSAGTPFHNIYYCFGTTPGSEFSVKSGGNILQNTEIESFVLSSTDDKIFIVCSGTNQSFISNTISDDTTSVTYTTGTLPDIANWSDVAWCHESPMSGGDYFFIVAKDYPGWVVGDGLRFTKYEEADFPMGDLVAIDDASGFNNSVVVTISTQYPIATYGNRYSMNLTFLPYSGQWSDLQYVNGVFIAGDSNTNRFVYSEDKGVTWKGGTLPFSACVGFGEIENGIVAFGKNEYAYCIDGNFDHWYTGIPSLRIQGDIIPAYWYT